MLEAKQIWDSVPNLTLAQAKELVLQLTIERERYIRRTVIAESALRSLTKLINPHLSHSAFEKELYRIWSDEANNEADIQLKINQEFSRFNC